MQTLENSFNPHKNPAMMFRYFFATLISDILF